MRSWLVAFIGTVMCVVSLGLLSAPAGAVGIAPSTTTVERQRRGRGDRGHVHLHRHGDGERFQRDPDGNTYLGGHGPKHR